MVLFVIFSSRCRKRWARVRDTSGLMATTGDMTTTGAIAQGKVEQRNAGRRGDSRQPRTTDSPEPGVGLQVHGNVPVKHQGDV